MELLKIYEPIEKELTRVEEILEHSLKKTENQLISQINSFLRNSPGKRLRPTLVLLSAKSTANRQTRFSGNGKLPLIAAAIELIHIASLIQDDVIDHSKLRHSKLTINSKWGEEIAITMAGYLYSEAFELIASSNITEIFQCMSAAAKAMCEGEFLQVCERENMDLTKKQYLLIIKKKTASLFAASCQVGTLISQSNNVLTRALREYGLNFGIAFQIVDDYLDLVGNESNLRKSPGQDIAVGELTLPVLNLFESLSEGDKKELKMLLSSCKDSECLQRIKSQLINSGAAYRTKELASSYKDLAKEKIASLTPSLYKESLLNLADYVIERGFEKSIDTIINSLC